MEGFFLLSSSSTLVLSVAIAHSTIVLNAFESWPLLMMLLALCSVSLRLSSKNDLGRSHLSLPMGIKADFQFVFFCFRRTPSSIAANRYHISIWTSSIVAPVDYLRCVSCGFWQPRIISMYFFHFKNLPVASTLSMADLASAKSSIIGRVASSRHCLLI